MTANSDDGYVVVHGFMLRDLGLSGVSLLVYARIYGFCEAGGEFYESRAATAEFLGTTSRSVTRAVNELEKAGLIEMTGVRTSPAGNLTKRYVAKAAQSQAPRAPDETSPLTRCRTPDEMSGQARLNPDGTSGEPVTGCHPIRKGIRKPYG